MNLAAQISHINTEGKTTSTVDGIIVYLCLRMPVSQNDENSNDPRLSSARRTDPLLFVLDVIGRIAY